MNTGHLLIVDPAPSGLDPEDWSLSDAEDIRIVHVHTGDGCDGWLEVCRGPHLWIEALTAIADTDPDEATAAVAAGMLDDAECAEHVWHGQYHEYRSGYGWTVPVKGCGFFWADWGIDMLPDDLLPGVYEVTVDGSAWDFQPQADLIDDPDPALLDEWCK